MSEKNDAALEAAISRSSFGPQPYEVYRHYKGGMYTIVATAIDEETLSPTVVYRAQDTATVWVRTLDNFLSPVDTDEGKGPRFTRYL